MLKKIESGNKEKNKNGKKKMGRSKCGENIFHLITQSIELLNFISVQQRTQHHIMHWNSGCG